MVAQEQGRFAEAEASYRQALDIFLEFGDRHSAARTYHSLGAVAQEQERFAEAEASYRQALDIYLEVDPRQASATATQLGLVLAETGRHADAAAVLMDAALLWHQLTGGWDTGNLRYLKRERAILGQATFSQLAAAKVPQNLRQSLDSGIDSAEDL